jgi:hypothetical protein
LGCETDHLPPSNAKVKNEGATLPLPDISYDIVLNYKSTRTTLPSPLPLATYTGVNRVSMCMHYTLAFFIFLCLWNSFDEDVNNIKNNFYYYSYYSSYGSYGYWTLEVVLISLPPQKLSYPQCCYYQS